MVTGEAAVPSMLQLFHRSNSDFRPSGSLRYCLKSCFKLHNESMNIWTHFGGACCFRRCVCPVCPHDEFLQGWLSLYPSLSTFFQVACSPRMSPSCLHHTGCVTCRLQACSPATPATLCPAFQKVGVLARPRTHLPANHCTCRVAHWSSQCALEGLAG